MFNRKIDEFVNDLIVAFPEINDFKVFKSMLELTIYMDPTAPQRMFNDTVAKKYTEKILDYNESFFLEEASYDENYTDINLVNKLKGVWKSLDTHNKSIIWKYLHVLLQLNRRCVNSK